MEFSFLCFYFQNALGNARLTISSLKCSEYDGIVDVNKNNLLIILLLK